MLSLVLDDERGAYGQAQRFAAVEDAEIAKALDEIEQTRRFSADRNRFALFAVWFAALLAALKLRIEEGAEIAITEEFVDLVERNRACSFKPRWGSRCAKTSAGNRCRSSARSFRESASASKGNSSEWRAGRGCASTG
jgi:hypothetical protein